MGDKTAVIYARVSSTGERQSTERQVKDLSDYALYKQMDVRKVFEENNEAILFGRYLRVNENDRWRFWHDKWANDPGLKEDMNDYFMLEELKKKDKEKK